MTPSGAVPADGDLLLATKLHRPGHRAGLVSRPRLTGQLDRGHVEGLALVIAPAGYGKTVLLAEWARRTRCPTAWLSLDPGDNDPAQFWRHVIAALDTVQPGSARGCAHCSIRRRPRHSRGSWRR